MVVQASATAAATQPAQGGARDCWLPGCRDLASLMQQRAIDFSVAHQKMPNVGSAMKAALEPTVKWLLKKGDDCCRPQLRAPATPREMPADIRPSSTALLRHSRLRCRTSCSARRSSSDMLVVLLLTLAQQWQSVCGALESNAAGATAHVCGHP